MEEEEDIWGDWEMGCTSFEPRPKPDITSPSIRRGNGSSGPESGPTIVGRGARGAASWDIIVGDRRPERFGRLRVPIEGQYAIE